MENKKAVFYKRVRGNTKKQWRFKLLIQVFFLTFQISTASSQVHSKSNEDTAQAGIEFFLKILERLQGLTVNPEKMSPNDKLSINLERRHSYNYGSYTVTNHSIHIGKIGAGITTMAKNGAPFAISGRIGIGEATINICDSSVLKIVSGYRVDLSFLSKDCCVPCYFLLENLDNNEKLFLSRIVGDSLISAVISEYVNVMPFWEILSKKFDFYDDSRIVPAFSDPTIKIMRTLFKAGKFESMKSLMFTQNRIFNWFAAEALVYFNNSVNFLTRKELRFASKFNGKKGYTKFRKPDTLDWLYK